jgi:hypothetical protein
LLTSPLLLALKVSNLEMEHGVQQLNNYAAALQEELGITAQFKSVGRCAVVECGKWPTWYSACDWLANLTIGLHGASNQRPSNPCIR